MRNYLPTAAAVLIAAVAVPVIAASGLGRDRGMESFDLGERDRILAEAPGCHVECRPMGARRTCVIRDLDCRAVCQEVPDCNVAGRGAPMMCAIMRIQR